jgi:hypothetical protein
MEPDGTLIKEVSSKGKSSALSATKGGHQYNWNMRYDGFKEFDGMVLYSSPNRGPKAVPGSYMAELIVNQKVEKAEFKVNADPRMSTTQEEYQQQFDYLISVRDQVSRAHQAITDIRELKADIDYMKSKLKKKKASAEMMSSLDQFVEKMEVIENNIHMTKNESYQDPLNYGIRINNRLSFLLADQQRGDYAPTAQAYQVRDGLIQELDKEIVDLNTVINESLPSINKEMASFGLQLLSDRLIQKP